MRSVLGLLVLAGLSPTAKAALGLDAAQMAAIRELTGGAADFARVAPEPRDHRGAAPYPGFLVKEVREGSADPSFESEWWVRNLKLSEAWEYATGQGIVVADCDAGYYHDQPEFRHSLLLEHRYDLADRDEPLKIDDGNYVGHGTAVAALIAAARDGQGTNGIAFDSKVVPLQNYNYSSAIDDVGKEEATAECVLRAMKIEGVRIIVLENQTWEGSSETYAGTREAVKLALEAGILIVSAAGNSGLELKEEAEHDTGSLIVGSLRRNGDARNDSNWGARVAIATYGEELRTLYGPNGEFGDFGGTSGATALMGGITALILSANPKLTPAQVKDVLVRTRVTTPGTAKVGGAVDVIAALRLAKDLPALPEVMKRQSGLLAQVRAILARWRH
ncbi:MAG: S8/S53 family peptidase [Bdellovibrionales bacterium]|nr:S8/S53 family peptidase [Bdellovibrionales bacterium]